MTPSPPAADRALLDAQQGHWEGMLGRNPAMFGAEGSAPARWAAERFREAGVERILELGAGQGRDTFFFAGAGFFVAAVEYAQSGVDELARRARETETPGPVSVYKHDVRRPLPFEAEAFGACFSHMLFCMALRGAELAALSAEVRRVLRPGGLCVYTVRHTGDAHFGTGAHRGENMYEHGGTVVHFFDRAMVDRLAEGWEAPEVGEFEEGDLPRRLFRVAMRKKG